MRLPQGRWSGTGMLRRKAQNKKAGQNPRFPTWSRPGHPVVGRQFIRGRQHNRIDHVYNL
jgi:hypothetical protein